MNYVYEYNYAYTYMSYYKRMPKRAFEEQQ